MTPRFVKLIVAGNRVIPFFVLPRRDSLGADRALNPLGRGRNHGSASA